MNKRRPTPYGDLHIYYLKGRVADDPALEDEDFLGTWQEEDDAFVFFRQPAAERIARLLRNQSALIEVDRFQMSYEQWHGAALEPLRVGRLTIVPAWLNDAAVPAADHLLLDPGVVFGTGTHPTTRDCLSALQHACEIRPVRRVLDLGTGTGLLAIAAARLGARQVVAVDLNRLAAETAQRNVRLNAMDARIIVVQGNAENFIDLASDLMVSNLHYAVMRDLVVTLGFRMHRQFILSGLLRSQAAEVEELLRRQAATILGRWSQEGVWHTFWGATTGAVA